MPFHVILTIFTRILRYFSLTRERDVSNRDGNISNLTPQQEKRLRASLERSQAPVPQNNKQNRETALTNQPTPILPPTHDKSEKGAPISVSSESEGGSLCHAILDLFCSPRLPVL